MKWLVFFLSFLLLYGCTTSIQIASVELIEPSYPELVDINQNEEILEYRWQIDNRPVEEAFSVQGNTEYSVQGELYEVWAALDSYSETGIASWRVDTFDGRETISGEIFDNNALQAAHRYLKIPCWVEVTNLLTQKKAVVRVNDRGPFRGDYEIDLSRGAAQKLGFGDRKTVPVKVELLGLERNYYVETDMVFGLPAAQELLTGVTKIKGIPSRIMPHEYDNRYRVEIGPLTSVDDARWIQRWLLINLTVKSAILRY